MNVSVGLIIIEIIIGMILIVISFNAMAKMGGSCKSKAIKDGFTLILVLGLMITTLSFGKLMCGSCNLNLPKPAMVTPQYRTYTAVFGTIAVIILIISSVMMNELTHEGSCNTDEIKTNVNAVFGLSSLISVVSLLKLSRKC